MGARVTSTRSNHHPIESMSFHIAVPPWSIVLARLAQLASGGHHTWTTGGETSTRIERPADSDTLVLHSSISTCLALVDVCSWLSCCRRLLVRSCGSERRSDVGVEDGHVRLTCSSRLDLHLPAGLSLSLSLLPPLPCTPPLVVWRTTWTTRAFLVSPGRLTSRYCVLTDRAGTAGR